MKAINYPVRVPFWKSATPLGRNNGREHLPGFSSALASLTKKKERKGSSATLKRKKGVKCHIKGYECSNLSCKKRIKSCGAAYH